MWSRKCCYAIPAHFKPSRNRRSDLVTSLKMAAITKTRVEWMEEKVERLVDQLEKYPWYECLWNLKTKEYHDRNLHQKALNDIVYLLNIKNIDVQSPIIKYAINS